MMILILILTTFNAQQVVTTRHFKINDIEVRTIAIICEIDPNPPNLSKLTFLFLCVCECISE